MTIVDGDVVDITNIKPRQLPAFTHSTVDNQSDCWNRLIDINQIKIDSRAEFLSLERTFEIASEEFDYVLWIALIAW
jgi:tRNA A37 threonylcarbamoyladenosine dehydratase